MVNRTRTYPFVTKDANFPQTHVKELRFMKRENGRNSWRNKVIRELRRRC